MRLVIAAAFAWSGAAIFYFALSWRMPSRVLAYCLCSAIVALSPALIELDDRDDSIQRLIASLLAISLLVKLYDSFRAPDRFHALGFRFYCSHLANWFWLVVRRQPPARDRAIDIRQVFLSAFVSIAAVPLLVGVFSLDWSTRPFPLEHCIKASTVFALLMPLSAMASAVWRLLFGPALEAMDAPVLSSTPAEFWRRWNLPAQQFLATYVFEPAGGSRRPVRATLFTFFVSGLVHEYLFGIATGKLQGWQMLFFLVQGAAVLVTSRWRPRGTVSGISIALTIAFNLATSVWFFRSVAAAVPFYAAR
jgi:hypothetical protein